MLVRQPKLRTTKDMRKWDITTSDGRYVRPLSPSGSFYYRFIIERFKLAWMVFTGKADALVWEVDNG